MANVKTVLPNLRCTLGEGPHWDAKDGVLYWVDIVGKTAFALRPSDGASRSWTFDQPVAAIVPRENDGLLVALADGLAFLDAESGETTPLSHQIATMRATVPMKAGWIRRGGSGMAPCKTISARMAKTFL